MTIFRIYPDINQGDDENQSPCFCMSLEIVQLSSTFEMTSK